MGNGKSGVPKGRASVLLVDDHPIVRDGFTKVINQESDLWVCGYAATAKAAFEAVGKHQPDLVVLDISLEGANGIEVTKSLLARYPKLRILVLSMHNELIYGQRALRAGAKGYIMKQAPTDEVIEAMRAILRGGTYLSRQMQALLVEEFAGGKPESKSLVERLSDRELEVLELIGHGQKTGQIARTLNLSVKTIETYRAHIKEKIKLKNGIELAGYAARWVGRQEQIPHI